MGPEQLLVDTNMDRVNGTRFTALSLGTVESLNTIQLTTTIILITTITFVLTGVLSNRYSKSYLTGNNGAQTVPAVPYWIPLLGHIPNMAIDADGFVKGLRQRYNQGAFALNFFGTRHNVVYTPGLATALLNQKSENANAEETVDSLLQTVFGMPKRDMPRYYESRTDLMACYKHLLTEPSLSEMVDETAKRVKANIANLVSFAASPVDQTPWERDANVKIVKSTSGEETVEASLLPLILHFCAHMAIPTLVGSDFLANFPDITSTLWTMDRGFLILASGLPRWLPIPTLTRAHIARKKSLDSICAFHKALDKHANGEVLGPEWKNLDDVGTLVKARLEVYRKYDWSIRARAAIEHSLLWAANANSNSLVFWMLNRIYSDHELLLRVRQEIESYVKPFQPQQDLPIAEPPRLATFDVRGLCEKCPLLKSCYIECLRLDTASWSLKIVKQDFVLQSREKESQRWMLRKGEYAHAAHDLHNTDPQYFENPMVWKADRHIKRVPDGAREETVDMRSIRPYGIVIPRETNVSRPVH